MSANHELLHIGEKARRRAFFHPHGEKAGGGLFSI
jgi:hypothetical protein